MRKKLVQLIRDGRYDAEKICNANDDCQTCTIADPDGNCKYGCIADLLIDNGVTIPVRCKDCKHGEYWCNLVNKSAYICRNVNVGFFGWGMAEDDFCSYGEGKDNG